MKAVYITSGVLVILLIAAILFDAFARKELFNYSLEAIQQFQAQYPNALSFHKFLSVLCSESILIPFIIIIFLFFPLNKCLSYITALILSNYFDNIMKIIYGNPRPYWVKGNLFQVCDGGFGNPSGHSFVSTSVYLSFAHILICINKLSNKTYRICLNVFIALFFLLIIIGIMISRVYLGVHSINQILYGCFLGAIVYAICFFVLPTHDQSPKEFYKSFTHNNTIITCFALYIGGILLAVILYFSIDNTNEEWIKVLTQYCINLPRHRVFNNDALFTTLMLLFLFGTHTGIVLAFGLLNKNAIAGEVFITRIVHWNKGTWMNLCIKVLLIIPFLIPMLLYLLISSDAPLAVIYLFKVALPFYCTGFLIFGPYMLACKYFKLLPEKEDNSNDEENKEFILSSEVNKVSNNNNI